MMVSSALMMVSSALETIAVSLAMALSVLAMVTARLSIIADRLEIIPAVALMMSVPRRTVSAHTVAKSPAVADFSGGLMIISLNCRGADYIFYYIAPES